MTNIKSFNIPRCFNTYNTNNTTGSDYILRKRRKTLFKNSQIIGVGNPANNIPPGYLTKDNGAIYNGPIYICPETSISSGYLIGAQNYELLYDVLKGMNPSPSNFNTYTTLYGNNWNCIIGNRLLTNQNCAISDIPNDGSCNIMYYLPSQDEGPILGNLENFPGMIVDPSNQLFYPNCINTLPNNYLQNVRINIPNLTEDQIINYFNKYDFVNANTFPYPLNFSTTKCSNASSC